MFAVLEILQIHT